MSEKFEFKGIWWLPDKPEEQISGTLRFVAAEGAVLELIGSFKDLQDMNKILEPEIILGISSNGKNITLYKCFETNSTISIPGFLTSSFYVHVVYVGVHFRKAEEIKFKNLSIHYLHLDEWTNISGFDIKYLMEEKEVIIKYKLPEPFQANIDDELKILINFRFAGPEHSIFQNEATIKQTTEIKVETPEAKPFKDYRKIMYQIQNFLTLGITEPVYPLAIYGITEENREVINDKTFYPPVEIFYELRDIPLSPKILYPSDMLFTFGDISGRFDSFLRNWFEKVDLLEPIYDLYFGTLYNPRMYSEQKFLSLVQAIESFHQRIHGGEYMSVEEYEPVYDALVNAIPDWVSSDLKYRLKEYLKYGREFSLRKRMKDIIYIYQANTDRFIGNKNAFIEKVVDTRNYQTHHDEDLKERAAGGEELDRLTQKLKVLLEVCLLTELGFSSEEIKGLFSRNSRYQYESIY